MEMCSTHAGAQAGWRCVKCSRALCTQCAGWRAAGHGRREVCFACNAIAAPIRERRALLQPFGMHSLVAAVRWPFHKEALFSAAACALVLWGLAAIGGLG